MARQIHYNAAKLISGETAVDPYLRPAFSVGNRFRRFVWNICWAIFYRLSPRPFHAWRAMLLRLFGAQIGPNCHFYPGSRVWAPWNLVCADGEFDISFHPSGFAGGYAQLAASAHLVRVGDVEVVVADLADVIRSKESAGRPKDLRVLPLLYRHLAARRAEHEAEHG